MTRNKKIVISVISGIVALIVLFSVITININSTNAAKLFAPINIKTTDINFEADFNGDSTKNLSSKNNAGKGFVKVAETPYLELYYKMDNLIQYDGDKVKKSQFCRYNVAVYDKKAKKLWTAIPDDKDIQYKKLTDIKISSLQSLANFDFYDIGKDNNVVTETNVMNELVNSRDNAQQIEDLLANDMGDIDNNTNTDDVEPTISNVTYSIIPNGIRFSYDLSEKSLKFALDFKISGDKFDVCVPADQIEDKLVEYDKLRNNKNKLAAKIMEIGNSVSEIKNLPAFKQLDQSKRDQLSKNLLNIEQSAKDVSNSLKSGSNTDKPLQETEDNLNNLQMNLMSFGDFTGVLDKYYTSFNDIKAQLIQFKRSTLCGLVTITPLPYFGAATNKENGYVFFPDRSGAISYFNVKHPEYASIFSKDVYSNYVSDIATYMGYINDEDSDKHEEFTTVSMPVFGIKHDNAAFVSIIAEGDADANISYTPYSKSSYMNSVNTTFYTRITTKNTNSEGSESQIIDPKIVSQDRRVRYEFLAGNDANYSGMAVKYRNHLDKYGLINKSSFMDSDSLPLFLNIFMGYKTAGTGANTKYRNITTYEQAQNILADLKSKGIGTINSYLSGWSTAGYYDIIPDNKQEPEKKLGGKVDLQKLINYAKANNISLGLENQFTFADKDNMTYTDRDIGTTKNYGNFTVSYWEKFMFNPVAVFNKTLDAVKKHKSFGTDNILLTNEGCYVYDDYNQNAKSNRIQTQNTFIELAKRVKAELGKVSYANANMYMAQVSDWFANVDDEGSKYLISDETVPFMQMVLHGYIPYTGSAYNNMYEINRQTLRYIEYGYLPFYRVTNDLPDVRENYTDFLFSTEYKTWSPKIVETVKKYQNDFGNLWKLKISRHETLKNGLVCTTYEDGTKILINYDKIAKTYNGTQVKAENYTIIK